MTIDNFDMTITIFSHLYSFSLVVLLYACRPTRRRVSCSSWAVVPVAVLSTHFTVTTRLWINVSYVLAVEALQLSTTEVNTTLPAATRTLTVSGQV
jgi:hypothetical protein